MTMTLEASLRNALKQVVDPSKPLKHFVDVDDKAKEKVLTGSGCDVLDVFKSILSGTPLGKQKEGLLGGDSTPLDLPTDQLLPIQPLLDIAGGGVQFLQPLRLWCTETTDDVGRDNGFVAWLPGDVGGTNAITEQLTAANAVLGNNLINAVAPVNFTEMMLAAADSLPIAARYELKAKEEKVLKGELPLPFLGNILVIVFEEDSFFLSNNDWLKSKTKKNAADVDPDTGETFIWVTGNGGKYKFYYLIQPFVGKDGLLDHWLGCTQTEGEAQKGLTASRQPRFAAAWRAAPPVQVEGRRGVPIAQPVAKKLAAAMGDTRLSLRLDFDSFIEEWKSNSAAGFRLTKLTTDVIDRDRSWTGLYEKGDDPHGLLFGSLDDILSQHDKSIQGGLRMRDLITWVDGTTRKWAGLWRAGDGGHAMLVGVPWDDFGKGWSDLCEKGLRLAGVETYRSNGRRLWAGYFAQATHPSEGYSLFWGDWDVFGNKWKEFSENGLRLVDLVTFVDGGKRFWTGVWRAGTDAHSLHGDLDLLRLKDLDHEANDNGMHLKLLQVW